MHVVALVTCMLCVYVCVFACVCVYLCIVLACSDKLKRQQPYVAANRPQLLRVALLCKITQPRNRCVYHVYANYRSLDTAATAQFCFVFSQP